MRKNLIGSRARKLPRATAVCTTSPISDNMFTAVPQQQVLITSSTRFYFPYAVGVRVRAGVLNPFIEPQPGGKQFFIYFVEPPNYGKKKVS